MNWDEMTDRERQAQIRKMQKGKRAADKKAAREAPRRLREIERKIDQAGKRHRREKDAAVRAQILRDLRALGTERFQLRYG